MVARIKKRSSTKKKEKVSNNELLRYGSSISSINTFDDLPRPEIEPNILVSELKKAQEKLLESGELGLPTIIGKNHDDEVFLGVICGPQINQIGESFAPKSKWICFTVETWMSNIPKSKKNPSAERLYEIYGSVQNFPSEYRTEAIMIIFESPNESMQVIQVFTRDEKGKPVLGEICVDSEYNHRFYM